MGTITEEFQLMSSDVKRIQQLEYNRTIKSAIRGEVIGNVASGRWFRISVPGSSRSLIPGLEEFDFSNNGGIKAYAAVRYDEHIEESYGLV